MHESIKSFCNTEIEFYSYRVILLITSKNILHLKQEALWPLGWDPYQTLNKTQTNMGKGTISTGSSNHLKFNINRCIEGDRVHIWVNNGYE